MTYLKPLPIRTMDYPRMIIGHAKIDGFPSSANGCIRKSMINLDFPVGSRGEITEMLEISMLTSPSNARAISKAILSILFDKDRPTLFYIWKVVLGFFLYYRRPYLSPGFRMIATDSYFRHLGMSHPSRWRSRT